MATITSNRNDNTGTHTTVNPASTTTWAGGVVPVGVDQVYVVGRRTTINQSDFGRWAGTRTITVASTSNFASSGFFYTVTNRGEIVKISYTGTTSTTFTGCSIDETDSFYTWTDSSGNIFNGSYVHNPAYIVEIASGQTIEYNELIIEQGGWVFVNGGTLKVNQGIILRDGRLVGRGNGTIIISRNSNSLNGSNIGYLTTENYRLSVLDLDGGETRVYGETTGTASAGDVKVTLTNITNGSFAVGDEVSLYEQGRGGYRMRAVSVYRDVSHDMTKKDEGFDVCGVSGNDVYLALRNGARGTIKAVSTDGSQKLVDVDPQNNYFNAGDIVVIDNTKYTVDSVEDAEETIYSYDFTNPSTSLSDFWVNDSRHVYSSGWNIESGVGIRSGTDSYRELTHKYLWRREVIVEAEMSPLTGYSTGTRGTGRFGIMTSYDPAYRWGHRGFDSFKTDILEVNDSGDFMHFYLRSMSNYASNRLSRDSSFRNETRTGAFYRIETRRGETKVSVNGREFTTELRRDGNFKGLVGLFSQNGSFRCRSLKIKIPLQRLRITTNDSISVSSTAYRSGIQWSHPSGSRLLKIASINSGEGNHHDLAFAYSGQYGSGEWPLIIQRNGANATDSDFPYLQNHDANHDYYENLGETTSQVGVTIDLLSQKTFTHVSFNPRTTDTGGFYGYNNVAIYGSNDLSSWTTLYGPTNDTKKWHGGGGSYGRLAFYPTGTASFRYVKFETRGDQGGSNRNRYVNVGVHDFTSGYKIALNNASDFAVGDKITVLPDSGFSWVTREFEAYQAWVNANATDPEVYMHGGWKPECTITAKSGNVLTLDRPIWWGYVEGFDSVTVAKTNRNFVVTGTMGPTNSSNDWRWPIMTFNGGSEAGRLHLMRNVRFDYIGSYRYSSSTSHNRSIRVFAYDYWNAVNFDGCVNMMSADGTTWVGPILFYTAHGIARNGVLIGAYTAFQFYYNVSNSGVAVYNNKALSFVVGLQNEGVENFVINYNEFASVDTGINVNTQRVERMSVPRMSEIIRNFVKGTGNTAFRYYDETIGPRRMPRVKIEANRTRATDDYAVQGRSFSGSPYVDSDFLSEHTGSRLSRYRNEGFISQGDTSSDLSYMQPQHNFNRYGYDLTFGLYHILKRDPADPSYVRIYNTNGDDFFAFMGMELDVLEDNVPFQVFVRFDYRIPLIGKLQDDGNMDGSLRCYSIQHGVKLQDQYTPTPSTLVPGAWNTFSYTFNTFASEEGKAAVYLARDSINGYVDVRNATAYVLTDNGDKIRVIGNTFRIENIWDQYRETRDSKRLTNSSSKPTKLRKFRF